MVALCVNDLPLKSVQARVNIVCCVIGLVTHAPLDFVGHVEVAEKSPVHDVPSEPVRLQEPGATFIMPHETIAVPFFATIVGFMVRFPVAVPDGKPPGAGVRHVGCPGEQNCGATQVVLVIVWLQLAFVTVCTMVCVPLQVYTVEVAQVPTVACAKEKSTQPAPLVSALSPSHAQLVPPLHAPKFPLEYVTP
jgi:hypothetical protein